MLRICLCKNRNAGKVQESEGKKNARQVTDARKNNKTNVARGSRTLCQADRILSEGQPHVLWQAVLVAAPRFNGWPPNPTRVLKTCLNCVFQHVQKRHRMLFL